MKGDETPDQRASAESARLLLVAAAVSLPVCMFAFMLAERDTAVGVCQGCSLMLINLAAIRVALRRVLFAAPNATVYAILFATKFALLLACCAAVVKMAPELALGYIGEFLRMLKQGGLCVFQMPEQSEDSGLATRLRGLTPKLLLKAYRRFRYGAVANAAEIEMNGIPEKQVIRAVEAAGGEVKHSGGGWYWACRNRPRG